MLYFKMAKIIFSDIGDEFGLSLVNRCIARNYLKLGEFDSTF